MKKQIFFAVIAAALSFTMANAQGGGGFPRRTVEERVKTVHDKLDSAFKNPGTALLAQLDSVFANYYRTQDAKREEMMGGGDREAMRAVMQELSKDRDDKLAKILSEAQMKQWKDEIEPALRPQRGPRPPGN